MKSAPLLNEDIVANGANMEVIVDHADLTQATAATAQVISLLAMLAAYQQVELVRVELLQAFQDTTDAANNTTPVTVGDGVSANRFLTATELNANGAAVRIKAGTGTKYVYGADDTVDITFGAPAAGKNLAALNAGKLRLLFNVYDARAAAVV